MCFTLPIDEAVVDGVISEVPLLGVKSICFNINLLSRIFLKKLRMIKYIPPRLQLGFAKLFSSALDNVLANPADLWRDPIDRLGLVLVRLADLTLSFSGVKKSNKEDKANMVQCKRKLGDGHFNAAIKVLTSAGVAPSTPDTLYEHPYTPSLPWDAFAITDDLLGSITGVFNMFRSRNCPSKLGEYITNVHLTPLVKPSGGICPIVVGTAWQRLVSKVSSSSIGNSMNTYLQYFKFGVSVPGDCEAVLHLVNRLIESKHKEVGLSMLLVDLKNPFNLVNMSVLLEETRPRRIDKTKLFWPMKDPRSMAEGVSPINISHPLNDVKLLGGSVSLEKGFCQDLALKRVSKTISLMEAIHKLHDPQCIESHGSSFQYALDAFNTTCNVNVLFVTTCYSAPLNDENLGKGDHAVHCSSQVGVKFRHNLVHDVLLDICSKVGIMVCKEDPMGFVSKDGKVYDLPTFYDLIGSKTHFKNLIKRVPYYGLDLWSLTQFFYDHVDDYTRMDLDFEADGNQRELSAEEAWEAIENFAQCQKEWDNPPNIISELEVANLKAQAKRLFRNEDVWVQMHRGIAWDKVENSDPQSTP
ncbi:hypothetical protein Tco_1524682 [Tanacetum coccineum]